MVGKLVTSRRDLLRVAEFVHDRYSADGFIRPNRYRLWIAPAQLDDTSVIWFREDDNGAITWTVTAVFERLPARLNFPAEVDAFTSKAPTAELINLASVLKDINLFRSLVDVCRFLLETKGIRYLVIEVTEDHAVVYRRIGFQIVAKAKRKHFCLDKYPVLMVLDLPEYRRVLDPRFFERFVKE